MYPCRSLLHKNSIFVISHGTKTLLHRLLKKYIKKGGGGGGERKRTWNSMIDTVFMSCRKNQVGLP